MIVPIVFDGEYQWNKYNRLLDHHPSGYPDARIM